MTSTLEQHTAMETGESLEPEAATPDAARSGHIGRIVAGTILTGLLAAVALVVGPLAGAEEHIISGSILLVFAGAWAMLALLAERRTDQPQRWAIAPAVFMGAAGASIVGFAPTGNPLAWVWPPMVAGLAIWMIVQARRALQGRTRAWLLYPVCATLVLSAVGGAYETYQESADADAYPMPGRLIDVGGHSLHINCTGTGSPTVVLEPGLGEPSTAMAWVTADVSSSTRVCVYDRAGRGWSESASGPLDGVQTASDLHTLLEQAGEPGPYVLAGHSVGGLYVLNFAALYPDEVAGMVLLDSMHPDQYNQIAGWAGFYEMFRRASAVLPSLARVGIGRVIAQSSYGDLPALARDEQRAFWSTPRHNRSVRDEFAEIRTAMDQAAALTSLGDRPLVVVTAMKDAQDGWMDAQDELAALSTNSIHWVVADAAHATLVGNEAFAAQSSEAILDVVTSIRAGAPLG